MALRHFLRERQLGVLFVLCLMFGVAGMLSLGGFAKQARQTLDLQSKTLLGADVVVSHTGPFPVEVLNSLRKALASHHGQMLQEVSFRSMAIFPSKSGHDTNTSRLVQVRAMEQGLPFYGELECWPKESAKTYSDGPFALIEEGLSFQFGLRLGDTIRIGQAEFRIHGFIQRIPGELPLRSLIGPRVFIPFSSLESTNLLGTGSLATYRVAVRFSRSVDSNQFVQTIEALHTKHQLEIDTVASRKKSLGNRLRNVYALLTLSSLVGLLLGSVATMAATLLYIRRKRSQVSVLKTVGASSSQILLMFIFHLLLLSGLSVSLGMALGLSVQSFLNHQLSFLTPVLVDGPVSGKNLVYIGLVSLACPLLFTSYALFQLKQTTPLEVLRPTPGNSRMEKWSLLSWFAIFLGLFCLLFLELNNFIYACYFCLGVTACVLCFASFGVGFRFVLRRVLLQSLPFSLKQGFRQLYRPENQTVLLFISIGFSSFLMLTLVMTSQMLLAQLAASDEHDQANIVLFDVQTDQVEGASTILKQHRLPILDKVPVVTMRLSHINGKSTSKLQDDPDLSIPDWVLRREYRSTYREKLVDTEQLLSGHWPVRDSLNIPISVEEGIAEKLQVSLGSRLTFDVQGLSLETEIVAIRKVNWAKAQPNFFVVFPPQVLEAAPQFFVLVSRAQNSKQSALLQKDIIQAYPSISVIDLRVILDTTKQILAKLSSLSSAAMSFSVLTGIFVLISATLMSQEARTRDLIILRTLGAKTIQLRGILLAEYGFLGGISLLGALILAVIAVNILSYTVFDLSYVPNVTNAILLALMFLCLILLVGMVANGKAVSTVQVNNS